MFLEPAVPAAEPKVFRMSWAPWLAGVICTAGTIAIFVSPQWLWDSIH
jgi:hypothetical protein